MAKQRPTLIDKLNQTRTDIDNLVSIRAKLNELKKLDTELSASLRERLGLGRHEGNMSDIEISSAPVNRLATDEIRAAYDTNAEWHAKYTVDTEQVTIRVKPKVVKRVA